MSAARHLHPAPGPKIFLPENQTDIKEAMSDDVHPVHPFQQSLIIDGAHQEHEATPPRIQ